MSAHRCTHPKGYPAQFDDTLFDIPKRGQSPKDVLEASKTLLQLKKDFDFKKIIQDLEELVLADSGKDEFNEIFKLIFAKIWDEKEALESRPNKVVEFRKALDPEITFDRINNLFHKACEEWPGIFKEGEDIELAKRHLQVCVGPIEGVRLMGSNLRIMDDAFEYLLPTEAKKKKGQFFTPRHVVEMCVRMLNPKRNEYVMDPACGSGGFAVSLLWGLAQSSELKLPIIIDTPLSRLDSTHRDNIVNNYFPNAGEQVIILSTDTEIDNNYYRSLKPHLSGAASLEFDQRQELTTFRQGYFWEKNRG